MLQQVMENIHNYFIKERHKGAFEIADGMISLPFMLEGQRFLIQGSVLNDGVYTYHAEGIKNDDDAVAVGLHDETFAGTICALAVPPAVIALSAEIKAWVDANSAALSSPYQSESFNGYSYTLKSGGGSGGNGPLTWRDQFGKQLDRWRRPCL